MDTYLEAVSETWSNLTTSASLVTDTVYLFQNIGIQQVILNEASDTPDDTERGIILSSSEKVQLKQKDAMNFYVRAATNTSEIAVTESY